MLSYTLILCYNRSDDSTNIIAMDSHPRRTNGFLTGCMVNILNSYASNYQSPHIEELARYVEEYHKIKKYFFVHKFFTSFYFQHQQSHQQ